MKKYNIKNYQSLFKDEKSVNFHIKNDDFFITMLSVFKLLKNSNDSKLNKIILNNLIKDFNYLNNNYSIIPKKRKSENRPEFKVKNQ